jgi:hypothetical protein
MAFGGFNPEQIYSVHGATPFRAGTPRAGFGSTTNDSRSRIRDAVETRIAFGRSESSLKRLMARRMPFQTKKMALQGATGPL